MRAVIGRGFGFRALFTASISITALSFPLLGHAAPGDINSINTGQNISAGTYFNTPGSRTTFINPNGGLWLHSGDLVRGLESNINKVPDGNGGTLYFRAPGNVVRLDGNIDVSAVRNGALYTGNGGKVFVDSGYLFQNGNIFANGANGGLVQFNVGGLTVGANAQITAQGFGGNGGAINISSPGSIDIRSGAIIDASGKVSGSIDTNIINIEGGLVNNGAIIRANGAVGQDLKPNDGDSLVMAQNPQLANNPFPPPISAGNGTNDTATMANILWDTPGNAMFRGGVIRLVASGQTPSSNSIINGSQLLSSSEKSSLIGRNNFLVQSHNGDVWNQNAIVADGALAKNGGTIILSAARDVDNNLTVRALGGNSVNGIFNSSGSGVAGGNGGTIVVTALRNVNNLGSIQVNGGQGSNSRNVSLTTGNGRDANASVTGIAGAGGQGGVLAFNYTGSLRNTGALQAIGGKGGTGGHVNSVDFESSTLSNPNPVSRTRGTGGTGGTGGLGGLILFSGNGNPTGGGATTANGGQGGQGGNAWTEAHVNSNLGVPSAISIAIRGAGGKGGGAGTVISPTAGSFTSGQSFSAKAGGIGNTGNATAYKIVRFHGITTTSHTTSPIMLGSLTSGPNQTILNTRRNEYIRHQDAAILFSQNSGLGANSTTLTGRLADALLRTVGNPAGITGGTLSNAEQVSNFVIGGATPQSLTADLVNSNINPLFFDLNSLTISNNGSYTNNTLWTPGVHLVGPGFHDIEFAPGGGHISWLVNGSVTNNQIVMTRGLWSGGSTNVAATQDVVNNKDFINITSFKDLLSGFTVSGPEYESTHAGSLTLKAGHDVVNNATGKMESNLIFFDIHPQLAQNPPIDWPKFLNGAQIGATVNLFAGHSLINRGLIGADALTYRNGAVGGQNPALTIGGIVTGRHGSGSVVNTGTITANGNAFFSPNEADGPRFAKNIFPATTSFNGTVDIK